MNTTTFFPSHLFLLLIFGLFLASCENSPPPTPMDLSKEILIPKPVSLTATGSSFRLNENTHVYVQGESEILYRTAQFLTDFINPATGWNMEVQDIAGTPESGSIYLTLSNGDPVLGDEGYELSITEELVQIIANEPAGLFNGIQTLRQILPASMETGEKQNGPWEIPTGTIRDYPNYEYRGAMLDVARHFFDVEEVKHYIDLISTYKMNSLHLHLTDDQGWRIEIKSWPKLTEIGGSSEVGGGKGGFFTQEDYKEIVRYAQERFITIIPEIDMPGHTNAALASYAELNCDGKARELYDGIEVGFSSLCTDKKITYEFVNDVIRELAEMTPGPYIHIGGDESLATPMEKYIPFVNQVQQMVARNGKQVMGWDEITHANLIPNSVAQHWEEVENAHKGVAQNAKILMSPAKKTYMDMSYDTTTTLGLHWAAYIEVDSAYMWDPADYTEGIDKEHIIGIEAPLWTETITNRKDLEYMVFPRLVGYSEIGWSPAAGRNWDEYKVRLGKHGERMKAMGINFYESKFVPWK